MTTIRPMLAAVAAGIVVHLMLSVPLNVVVSAFGLTGWPSFAAHASVSAVAAVMQLTVMGAQLKRSTGRGLFEGGK